MMNEVHNGRSLVAILSEMKSELQERLVPIIERAHKLSLSWRTVPAQGGRSIVDSTLKKTYPA